MDLKEESLEAEAQLEDSRQDLKEAVQEIRQKVEITKERLDPARFIRQHPLTIPGIVALIGFLLGLRSRMSAEGMNPALKAVAEPEAKTFWSALGHRDAKAMVRNDVRTD